MGGEGIEWGKRWCWEVDWVPADLAEEPLSATGRRVASSLHVKAKRKLERARILNRVATVVIVVAVVIVAAAAAAAAAAMVMCTQYRLCGLILRAESEWALWL